jgi:hypothetical protein
MITRCWAYISLVMPPMGQPADNWRLAEHRLVVAPEIPQI